MRPRILVLALALLGVAAAAGLGAFTFGTWKRWLPLAPSEAQAGKDGHHHHAEAQDQVQLSPQARANLRLVVRPVRLTSHWRTIQVPGMVSELPGKSDHAVTSPVAGVIQRVAVLPWDTVRPRGELFTLGLMSESIQSGQLELHKTARELQINQEERSRLAEASRTGVVPAARVLELDYQKLRLQAALDAYDHQLEARGLTPAEREGVKSGKFVTHATVRVPVRSTDHPLPLPAAGVGSAGVPLAPSEREHLLEVQELKVHLGEQVQAGQLLCYLTDHQALYVEGRGFRHELPLLERAARQGWFARAEFAQDEGDAWLPFRRELPALALAGMLLPGSVVPLFPPDGLLPIRFLANTVEPGTQTCLFYLPLTNQHREHVSGGKTYRTWRHRPGQRVLLHVPVESLHDVFVLPAEAVVREGPEVYVFRQNGDFFERRPVHVLHADRRHVILANDGSISPGNFVAQNAAAQLNFALKAQASRGDESGHHHHHHH